MVFSRFVCVIACVRASSLFLSDVLFQMYGTFYIVYSSCSHFMDGHKDCSTFWVSWFMYYYWVFSACLSRFLRELLDHKVILSYFLRNYQFTDGVLDLYFMSSSLQLCLLLCLLLCSSLLPQSGLWWPMIGFTLPIYFQSPSLLPYHTSSDGGTFDSGSCWGLLYIFKDTINHTANELVFGTALGGYTSCRGPRPIWVDIHGSFKNRGSLVYLLGEKRTFYMS